MLREHAENSSLKLDRYHTSRLLHISRLVLLQWSHIALKSKLVAKFCAMELIKSILLAWRNQCKISMWRKGSPLRYLGDSDGLSDQENEHPATTEFQRKRNLSFSFDGSNGTFSSPSRKAHARKIPRMDTMKDSETHLIAACA